MQDQKLWREVTEKKFQMLRKTDTQSPPWFIIRSDDKYVARLVAMKVILNVAKYRGRKRNLDFSLNPDIVIRGKDEYNLMKKELQVFRH